VLLIQYCLTLTSTQLYLDLTSLKLYIVAISPLIPNHLSLVSLCKQLLTMSSTNSIYARRPPPPPPQQQQQQVAAANEAAVRKRRRRTTTIVIIVIVVIIVLALIGVLIWWLLTRNKSSSSLSAQGDTCNTDRDCQTGLVCSLNKCRSAPGTGSCSKDTECPANYVCYQNKCVGALFAGCDNDSQCLLPLHCVVQAENPTNLCVTQNCTADTDCRDATRESCKSGSCILKPQQPCIDNFQCTSVSGDIAACSNGRCLSKGGLQCSENADCLSGSCDAGFCACNNDVQCPSSQTCNLFTNQCI
jgi:hypothetical protein